MYADCRTILMNSGGFNGAKTGFPTFTDSKHVSVGTLTNHCSRGPEPAPVRENCAST